MKQMGSGQHQASSSLVAYVQDGLDLENLKSLLHLLLILQYITNSKV